LEEYPAWRPALPWQTPGQLEPQLVVRVVDHDDEETLTVDRCPKCQRPAGWGTNHWGSGPAVVV
jgi:hypothetical protein